MAVYTLFGQPASPATLTADSANYTMGVQFSVSQAATLTAIWFYSATGAVSLPSTIALYQVSGQVLVVSQAASWSAGVGTGWVRAPLNSPPALTVSAAYKGCIYDGAGSNFYSSTGAYWSSGAGAGGVTNGPLSAPNNAGGDGGQDTFNSPGALAYPATSFNATNYWVDVEVTTSGAPPAGPAYVAFMSSS